MVSWYHDIIMIMKINWTRSANQILIWDFDIVIDLFTEYHDIVMLSWYIKLSKPFTLSQIRANVVDFDIAIDNSMISRCCDIIMVVYQWENQNIISSYTMIYHGIIKKPCKSRLREILIYQKW